MDFPCSSLDRRVNPSIPYGSRFDCILLERQHTHERWLPTRPVQLRPAISSFLELDFFHLMKLFLFPLPGVHVFPEIHPNHRDLLQLVKEQETSFSKFDQILVATFLCDLMTLFETRDGGGEFCERPRGGSTPHNVLRPMPGSRAATHGATSSCFVCLKRGLQTTLGKVRMPPMNLGLGLGDEEGMKRGMGRGRGGRE